MSEYETIFLDACARLTPSGTGILSPSSAMTNGNPPLGAVVLGKVIGDENEISLLLLPAVTVKLPVVPVFVKVAETCDGLGGRNPAS